MKHCLLASLVFLSIALNTYSQNTKTLPVPSPVDATLIKGFDLEAAQKMAMQKSKKPAEQKEYLDFLVRKFIAEKKGNASTGQNHSTHVHAHKSVTNPPSVNNTYCPNAGFENIDFSSWTGGTFTNSLGTNWNTFTPVWTSGISTLGTNIPAQAFLPGFTSPYPNRHTIMTIPPQINVPPYTNVGWDSIAINPQTHLSDIPFVPSFANGTTVRLGNANNNFNEAEMLRYSMIVTPQNSFFTYSYAVVIYDGGHFSGEQPFFKVRAIDANGNSIPGCGQYQVESSQLSSDSSFIAASYWSAASNSWIDPTPGGINPYYYKKWTSVSIDVSAYIGQIVTVEFQTGDCLFGGHWAYAYIDAHCQPTLIHADMCAGSSSAMLTAPSGYAAYQWLGPNSMTPVSGANNDTLLIASPVAGDVYYCQLTGDSGCVITSAVVLNNTSVQIQNISTVSSCASGSSGSVQVTAIGSNQGYNYLWTEVSSGNAVGGNSSSVSGLPPGTYSVVVSSPGCGQADTSVVVLPSQINFYSLTQHVCNSPATLNAPAGSNYIWYDSSGVVISGANAQTISINNIVGTTLSYFVTFSSVSGCKDSVQIIASQGVNLLTQTENICSQVMANLTVPAGATNVNWYDCNWPYPVIGNNDSINISNPVVSSFQPYYVSYTNPGTGCKDSVRVFLSEIYSTFYFSNITSLCYTAPAQGSAEIHLNTSGSAPYTFAITGPGSYAYSTSGSADSVLLNGLAAGTYTVNISSAQCNLQTDSFTINYIPPAFLTAYTNNVLCGNDSAQLTLNPSYVGNANCQLTSTTACSNPNSAQLGTNSLQNFSTTWPTVYGNWYSNEKYQILYSASDLHNAGFTAGNITSIAFDVAAIPAGTNQNFINYTIKMACTGVNDLGASPGSFLSTSMQPVFGPATIQVNTLGWQVHNFSQAYGWDGVSNLLVEICYDWVAPSTPTYNMIVNQSVTNYASYSVFYSDGVPACGSTGHLQAFNQRPNTQFTWCNDLANPADYTYLWQPSAGLSDTVSQTVTATPTVTTTYTVVSTPNAGGCPSVDSVTVYVNQIPPPVISANGDTLVASQGTSYQWLLNDTIVNGATGQTFWPSQNGNYSVIVFYGNCGQDTSATWAYHLIGAEQSVLNEDAFSLYPNPATEQLNVFLRKPFSGTLTLLDVQGKLLYSEKIVAGQTMKSISLSNFAAGLYFVQMRTETGLMLSKKVVVGK